MSSNIQKSGIKKHESPKFQPPSFIPDAPAPEWVRSSLGNRDVIPSSYLLKDEHSLNNVDEKTEPQKPQTCDLNLSKLSINQLPANSEFSELIDNNEPLKVDIKVLSTLCHVKWTAPPKRARDHYIRLRLLSNNVVFEEEELSLLAPYYEFNLLPGRKYKIDVDMVNRKSGEVFDSYCQSIRSVFSLLELDALYLLAKKFVTNEPVHMIQYLYRVKPRRYFEDIKRHCNSEMVPYLKDNSGHLASPINRKLKGLFFLGSTQNGTLPSTSPFGDTRFTINVLDLLSPTKINLYFTDFYCSSRRHYVTVVVCEKGSSSDLFCKENIKLLEMENNPFLRIIKSTRPNKGPEYLVFVNNVVHVEICYTEKILLSSGTLTQIQSFGSGTSIFGGLPNNKRCLKCNLITAKKN